MHKKILFLIGINLLGLSLKAQNTPVEQWVNTAYGSTSGDEASTCSYRDNVGYTYVAGFNTNGLFVVKFDNTGLVVYSREHVDSNNVAIIPKIVQPDAAGNIYIGGYKFYGGDFHIAALMLNNDGDVIWESSYNTQYGAIYLDAMVCDNPSSPGFFAYTGKIDDSVSVGKINLATGNFMWNQKYIPMSGYTSGRGQDIKFSGGNLYCCGVITHPLSLNDAFVMKLNGAGTQMYANAINGSINSYDHAAKIVVNSSGEAFIYGAIYDPGYQFFLAKFSSVGNYEWKSNYFPGGADAASQPMDMVFNNTFTQIYTLGKTDNFGTGSGAIALFDPVSGTINHSAILNYPIAPSDELFKYIAVDNTNNYYIAGISNNSQWVVTKKNAANIELFNSYYTQPVTALNGLHVDNTGNIFLAGSINQSTSTYNDVAIAKFSSAGTFLWDGYFDSKVNSSDYTSYLLMDNSNNVTMIGNVTNDLTDLDVLVRKYDAMGNELWSNTIDYGTSYSTLNGYAQTNANEIYVSSQNDLNYSDITKMDVNGNILWSGTTPFFTATGFSCTPVGDYFFQGENYTPSQSNFKIGKFGTMALPVWTSVTVVNPLVASILNKTISDASGNVYGYGIHMDNSSKYWLYLEKYNSSGVWQWGTELKGHDSTAFVNPTNIVFDASGNIIVSGYVRSVAGKDAIMMAKLNATGGFVFKKIYNAGDTRNLKPYSMYVNSSDEIFFSGSYAAVATPMSTVGAVLKFSSTGNFVWEFDHTTVINNDAFYKVAMDVDGNLIASGSQGYYPNPFTGGSRLMTVKVNSTGTLIWEKLFDCNYPGSITPSDIKLTNNRIYITGAGQMSAGNNQDLVILKYCDNPAPVIIDPLTSAPIAAANIVCNGFTVNLGVLGSAASYVWHPYSETTLTLNTTLSGAYSVTTVQTDGCSKISDTVNVIIKSLPATPSICAVTVDSLSTHNIIYWDKSAYTDVTAFVIYREDVTNIYTPVGSVPYDSLSEFHDYGANPNVTTKRYKLSAIDTCGTESLLSPFHNTLYVTSNSTGDFSWNLYEIEGSGNPVTNFNLYRDDNGTGVWNVIGTTAGTQQILSDPAYLSFPDGAWRVETVWGITCSPTRAGISTSRSNLRKSSLAMGENEISENTQLILFPNPATNTISLNLIGFNKETKYISLKDASGRLIEQKSNVGNSAEFNLNNVERGIYFIEVISASGKFVKQFVKL